MKFLTSVVLVVVLAMAVPANAQNIGYIPQTWDGVWYRIMGNNVQMLTADNLGMVGDLTDQLRRAGYRSLADDLRWNGAVYGLQTAGGFLPMYDRNMRPMGRHEATITGAAIGAAIGYGVSGNSRGTAIGAAGGAIVGLITRRGKNNNNQRDNGVIVTPPSPGQGVRIASDGTPVAVGARPGGYPQPEPEWQMLRNEFSGVTIYARVQGSDPDQPIVIPAGQTVTVQIPRGSQIWAEAQVCINEGCTVQRWRQDVGRRPLPQGAGWVFYNPEEGR